MGPGDGGTAPPSGATNLLNDLLNALTGPVISSSHGLYNTTGNNPQTILSGDVSQFLTHKVNTTYNSARPKAFLNWVAFDNQLKAVDGNSGVIQIPAITGTMAAQPMVAPMLVMQKNGYIYIYLSNESAQNVFFDNLVIHHNRGPILQEDHYYPFGLTMSAISTTAPLKLENRFKFNGKELQSKEFSDNTGLEWYDYGARMYDPQIGKFRTQDQFSEKFIGLSPYQYGANNPIRLIDINGDSIIVPKSLTDDFIANEAFNNFASSKQGIKFLSQFAREGQIIAGHKYKKTGKYDNKKIDISYGTEEIADMGHGGDTKDFIGENGRLTIDVLTNTYGKRKTYNEIINTTLGANPTTKQLANQYGKMIFSRTGTIFHESFIHAELTAQDFMDNGKVDYSNISSQNRNGGVGNWQHNQVYYNNIKNMWPGDAYRALIDINGNMNLNYTNKEILQNIWFYNGGKEIQ